MLKMNYVENLAHELYAVIEGKSAGNQSVVRKVRKHVINIVQIQSNACFKVLKFVLFLPDDQIIAEHSVQLGKYPFFFNLYLLIHYAIITMTHYLIIIF